MIRLPQTVTYWTTSSDENGDKTFSAGIAVAARWKEVDGVFTDENGNDHKVVWHVYSNTLIPKRSLVVLSDMDGVATPPSGARTVLNAINNPSMNTTKKMVL